MFLIMVNHKVLQHKHSSKKIQRIKIIHHWLGRKDGHPWKRKTIIQTCTLAHIVKILTQNECQDSLKYWLALMFYSNLITMLIMPQQTSSLSLTLEVSTIAIIFQLLTIIISKSIMQELDHTWYHQIWLSLTRDKSSNNNLA